MTVGQFNRTVSSPFSFRLLRRLRQRGIVELHELVGVKRFNGISFTAEVNKFNLKYSRLINFNNSANLALVQFEIRQVLIKGYYIKSFIIQL